MTYYKSHHKWVADNDTDEEEEELENPIHDLLSEEKSADQEKESEEAKKAREEPEGELKGVKADESATDDNPWLTQDTMSDTYFVIANRGEKTIKKDE